VKQTNRFFSSSRVILLPIFLFFPRHFASDFSLLPASLCFRCFSSSRVTLLPIFLFFPRHFASDFSSTRVILPPIFPRAPKRKKPEVIVILFISFIFQCSFMFRITVEAAESR
jgi:hypothetical protein